MKEAIKRQKSDFVGNCVKKTCETCFQTRRTEILNRDEMLQVFLFILCLYELNISTQSVYHTTVSSFFPILLGFFPPFCVSHVVRVLRPGTRSLPPNRQKRLISC